MLQPVEIKKRPCAWSFYTEQQKPGYVYDEKSLFVCRFYEVPNGWYYLVIPGTGTPVYTSQDKNMLLTPKIIYKEQKANIYLNEPFTVDFV